MLDTQRDKRNALRKTHFVPEINVTQRVNELHVKILGYKSESVNFLLSRRQQNFKSALKFQFEAAVKLLIAHRHDA